ncbi:MAG: type I-E CRISPR-associated protein Cas6/Cse3/CasE [Acidithiobacillus caldus]|uniref:type I-E CRISPR-associated protein Cas6/Cse3/CasE n=1 Tax=Acidithiobacillus caldus TaxID=33059 RepID=UPI0028151E33|nr:type I-E CRISPR-associated protein Cas6/Cse3/CasE [Acidithiobacillus caldus]WMT47819.1 MAG: type I-E CRISPR-associated protein Cas6/Cse3/CasE [Acidithiobacillus caldus]
MKILDGEALHRKAWDIWAGKASVDERDFLFAPDGDALVFRSRSEPLPATPEVWRMRSLLAPVMRCEHRERVVKPREFRGWLASLLERHGWVLRSIEKIEPMEMTIRRGWRLTVVDTVFTAQVVDRENADQSYRSGIGRYKAFGCGMLIPQG